MQQFTYLKDGEEVEYELGDGDKGLHATRVIRVNVKEKKQKGNNNSCFLFILI